MLIRHYTKPHWIKSILDTGFILPERNNDEETCRKAIEDFYGPGYYRTISVAEQQAGLRIQRAKGDQVWFTTENRCNTAVKGMNEYYFEFDSDEIGAVKWHHYKKKFTSAESKLIISVLDRSAKQAGDDPYCYWVCEQAVDVTLAKNYEDIKQNAFISEYKLNLLLKNNENILENA
jgi:hypothetical protein